MMEAARGSAVVAPESGPLNGERRRFVARSFAVLFGLGGTAVLLSLLLDHPRDQSTAGMVVPATIAIGVAAVCLLFGRRLPPRAFYALPPLGSVLVTGVSASAGADLRVAYASF